MNFILYFFIYWILYIVQAEILQEIPLSLFYLLNVFHPLLFSLYNYIYIYIYIYRISSNRGLSRIEAGLVYRPGVFRLNLAIVAGSRLLLHLRVTKYAESANFLNI